MDTPQDPLWLKVIGRVLGWAIVIGAMAMGFHVTRLNYEYPRTDDAAVTANVVGIAPHVSGALTVLNVKDDQLVNPGDPLFTIDPRPYEATVARAKAALMLARSELQAMSNSISAAESMVKVRDAELSLAQSELRRYLPLLKTEAIDALSVDTARMGERTAEARLAAAQQDLQQQQNLLAQFGTLNARIAAAEAELQSEQINLDYCRVASPFPARVANMEISAGEFARQGEAIFALVDTRTWYVVANFRETFVDSIHAGQEVDVYLMAYPDRKFRGKVEGIGWGIQTEDSTPKGGLMLVKPTLNWVRLAQRIPVRIVLEAPDLKQPYRMGMTAVVTVRKGTSPPGAQAPSPKP